MSIIRATCIVGARPNFIKMAAIVHAMRRRPHFDNQLVHTGQHFSPEVSDSFFKQLDIPHPDINLAVGGGSQSEQTAEIMKRIEPVLLERRPDVLIVVGDVTSTLAASLVAVKLGIKIAHVESGLRSFDRTMPEEINRIVTDAVADFLFTTEPSAEQNLTREGIAREKIFLVGNVMIDTLLRFRAKAAESTVLAQLGLTRGSYAVLTLHRPSNVDDPERLGALLTMLNEIGREIRIVFPVHPRTRQRIEAANLSTTNLLLAPPQPYLDFLRLNSDARLVLTDSGGIQEETTILQVPCLTLRENTERPVTIHSGTNRLVGVNAVDIRKAIHEVLAEPMPSERVPELWDGRAGDRILDILERVAPA